MAPLPAAQTVSAFEALDLDSVTLRDAATQLLRNVGVFDGALRRLDGGSLPVYDLGDERILKLYPPCYADEGVREARWLVALEGRLAVPTPRLLAHGDAEGWMWVLMSRLTGASAAVCWPRVPVAQRIALSRQLSQALAALHALPPDPALAASEWTGFVHDQRAGVAARQRRLGLGEPWSAALDPWLSGVDLGAPPEVPIHTEVMREHVFVEEVDGRWALSGLLDFEPSTLGAAEYEFASVGLFWSCGDPALLRAVLLGYGTDAAQLGPAFERRVLAWALLHRYSNVPWYLRRMPAPDGVATWDALAAHWFGVAPCPAP